MSQCPELDTHGCEYDQFPADPEFVQGLLCQLDPYKCMGPDRIHPRILNDLADVIARSLSMMILIDPFQLSIFYDHCSCFILILLTCIEDPEQGQIKYV